MYWDDKKNEKIEATEVFEKVAEQNGVEVFEVRREIETISPNRQSPSAEELLAYLTEQVKLKKSLL